MGPLCVVLPHPLCTDLPHLVQRLTHIGVEDLMPDGPIKALDIGVLIRLAGLNMPEGNAPLGAPRRKSFCDEFWTVIHSNRLGLPLSDNNLFQDTHHPLRGQGRIHFDRQDFSDAFIQQIQRPKPTTAVQGVAHEIHRPDRIRLWGDHQRLVESDRESLLGPAWQIQPELTIDAPQPLVIPSMARVP